MTTLPHLQDNKVYDADTEDASIIPSKTRTFMRHRTPYSHTKLVKPSCEPLWESHLFTTRGVQPINSQGDRQPINSQCDIQPINSHGDIQPVHSQGDSCCIVVVLLFYVHGKHLRSCRDGQLT